MATICNSKLSDNSAPGDSGHGGGIWSSGSNGTLTVSGCTLSGNSAGGGGGGIEI